MIDLEAIDIICNDFGSIKMTYSDDLVGKTFSNAFLSLVPTKSPWTDEMREAHKLDSVFETALSQLCEKLDHAGLALDEIKIRRAV